MEIIKTIEQYLEKIFGNMLQGLSTQIGQQFFNHVISVTVPHGSTAEEIFRSPGFDVWVNQVKVQAFTNGSEIVKGSASRDMLTLQIEDTGNSNALFGSNPIDIFALDDIGQNRNFEGFLLPRDSHLTFELAHTEQNTGTDIIVKIYLSGKKVKREGFS